MSSSQGRKQNVCHQFAAKGSCSFPNCRFLHEARPGIGSSPEAPAAILSPPNRGPKAPCQFFHRHGNCKFGSSCRFSHDTTDTPPASFEDPGSSRSLYREWNQLMENTGRGSGTNLTSRGGRGGYGGSMARRTMELTPDQMERYLEGATRILDIGSTETIQQLIRDLASDRGLHRVNQVVGSEFVAGYSPSNLSFQRHCVPFLKILAHEEIRSSLVLENEVGTLFNFIYGPGGRRGTEFFERVATSLTAMEGSGDRDLVGNTLYIASLALFNTLNLNHAAVVQDEFKTILIQLDQLLARCSPQSQVSNSNAAFIFRSAHHVVSRIKILLKIADTLPSAVAQKTAVVTGAGIDLHQVDFPGELSREGPRHDNDHAEIVKIKILPTSEEISSHRNEFLPQRSLAYPHHLEGISRVLDFQFRLLREDTSGQIREAVRTVIHTWDELVGAKDIKKDAKRLKSQMHNVRTLVYQNAQFETMKCSNRDGIILTASFDQPVKVQALKATPRKEWWERAKYLAVGSLLCLVDAKKRVTFLVVSERKVIASEYKRLNKGDVSTEAEATGVPSDDLASDPLRGRISLRFAEAITREDVDSIFLSTEGPRVLVEFPGLLFASFSPILKSLQQISKDGSVPFTNWLAPSPTLEYTPDPNSNQYVDVPPPLYMMKDGAKLHLDSITKGMQLTYSVPCALGTRDLEEATTLDHGQSEALLTCFSKELALIQGPPGTGKSYLGVQIVKVLLANRDQIEIGPIICVCYTNHALDQFLEHLLEDGITNIVRIGTRSKSERVQQKALHILGQRVEQTPTERLRMMTAKSGLIEIEKTITAASHQLYEPASPAAVKSFLEEAYPVAFMDIFGDDDEDEEGFKVVKRKAKGVKRNAQQRLDDWLQGRLSFRGVFKTSYTSRSNRPIEDLRSMSVLAMSAAERERLLEYWYEELKEKATQELLDAAEEHAKERQSLSRQQNEQERRCLQQSHVIGLTTTGFASHADLIRSLKAKVLLCEEAGEVLEAHTLTALLPNMEHAILIGDHLQLRPQIMKHEFSIENPKGGQAYGLNTSLFERLVDVERFAGKGFPIAKLDTQRRMHPSIANLVRNTLYPGLQDHASTETHPVVAGMAKRLFWMDHRHLEASEDKLELIQTSHANEFETDMVVGLVRHLSRQGVYKSGEIAVLTPYLRQLFNLRRKLATTLEVMIGDKDQEQLEEAIDAGQFEPTPLEQPARVMKKGPLLSEVRVATVDNFQGEEAKVIIISLVRSNQRNKCGFLKTSNRINVLLSRARDGMYIIGNAETCGQVGMWKNIITIFEKDNNIDKHLQICCARHPDTPIFITRPDDFHLLSPEGGCRERCQWRLECGHPCLKKCHSELLHRSVLCLEPCNRAFKHCGHACPKHCGDPCDRCRVEVPGVKLPCGHTPKTLCCYQLQEIPEIRCTERVQRTLNLCGHEATMLCCEDPKTYICKRMCDGQLSCGHKCTALCSSCTRRGADGAGKKTTHGPCRITCGRNYSTCPHRCNSFCHGEAKCPPCSQPCAIRCDHSVCGKRCQEPCAPCPERCTWGCKHRGSCDMPCAVPCNLNPCSERCDQQLDCGHQCPSVCGETCPTADFCQECGTNPAIMSRQVDLITLEAYSEIDLDSDPIIVPTCGHFYTMSTYDSHMGMENAYRMTLDGRVIGPRALDGSEARENLDPDESPEKLVVRACPDCRAPLRNIHRYNRIVKVAYLDESTKRFCTAAQEGYLKLYKDVSTAQNRLSEGRPQFLSRLSNSPKRMVTGNRFPQLLEERMQRAKGLLNAIWAFAWTVVEQEQPYVRVRDMVLAQRRREQSIPESLPGGDPSSLTRYMMDSSVVQMGFRLKAYNLFNDFRWDTLWDLHTIAESPKTDKVTQRKLRRRIINEIPWAYNLCSEIVEECEYANLAKYEVEARVCRGRFVALYRTEWAALNQLEGENQDARAATSADQEHQWQHPATPAPFASEEGLRVEKLSLDRCDTLCEKLPGTVGPLKAKIDDARKLLNGGTFYSPVSAEEREAVYRAMAREFSSTGRWYTCQNGHPFTIGDCGAPRELAACPECGSGIGGSNRGLASGVARANEFAELDQRIGRMGL